MKLNLKKLDCRDCKCDNVWFKEDESARCIDCGSRNLIGKSYSFYINFSLEDGLYMIVTEHCRDDNTSYSTEDKIYTLRYNGQRSGYVSQGIKDMAEKVLSDYTEENLSILVTILQSIKEKMKGG